MLFKDVREFLYKDVDTDNGPSSIINTAIDDIERRGQLNPPDESTPAVEPSVEPNVEPNVEIDSHQRVIRRTDANGHVTRFDYAGFSDPARISFPDGACFDFQHTDSGCLEKFLIDHTSLANYEVDPDSGSWKVGYADGTHAQFVMVNGRVARAVNPAGTVKLKYDDNGLLMSETFEGRTVTYHRNETGHLIGLTTPFGHIIHYRRDSDNRVCCIKEWSGRDIRIEYATNGVMESITYPNGTRLCQQSTADGLPAELRLTAPGTDETVWHKIYQHDHLSRITRVSSGDHEIDYTYDNKGRLTGADSKHASGHAFFTVDGKSNRLSDNHRLYDINAADRLVQAGETEFQYDHLGNLIQGTCPRGIARYRYIGLNRLGSFTLDDECAQYRYDALGRRVEKKVNGVTTRYFWAGSQLLHEVQRRTADDRSSTGVTDYLFFPGEPALLAIRRDQECQWASFGHRYEVLCLTTDGGRPIWQAAYDSFGKAHIEKGAEIFQPFRLAGQYQDNESGLHYHQNRYYDPELGRYLSMTPLFLESGSDNFYIYGKGDPINHVDHGGVLRFAPILIGNTMESSTGGHTEVDLRHRTETEMNIFAIAKAALLGGVMNAAFSRLGLIEEVTPDGAVMGNVPTSILSGLVTSVLLSEKFDSATEESPQGKKVESPIDPKDKGMEIMDCNRINDSHKCIESGHINALTGEVTVSRTDFILAGRIPMPWSCHYQSRNTYTGLLGVGWQTPADARLKFDDKGSVLFFDGGPIGVLFDALPVDKPIAAAANGALLTSTQAYYQVRLKSGLTYYFPKKISQTLTHVARISDIHDNFLTFYREDTVLTEIRDNSNQCIHINCEGERIVTMKRQDKPLAVYCYEGEHLTAAVDALGHQKNYYYGNGVMVGHMDKNKHSFYFKYEKSGRCIRTWDDSGLYEYQFDYSAHENCTHVTDSIGHKKTYVYDHPLRKLIEDNHTGTPITREYDEMGRILTATDELDRSTAYQYDETGNITGVNRADTRLIALTYDNNHRPVKLTDANGNIHELRFDDYGRLTEEINPLGERVQYTYNRQGDLVTVVDKGLTTTFKYEEHGLVSTVICGKNRSTIYRHDASGNTTAVIDPTGQATRYVYDDKYRLIQTLQPSGINQSFDWDPEDNLLIHTDPNGRQTRFEYSVGNKIIRRRNPDDTSVSFQYDTEGNLINIINERGQCYYTKYDYAGRATVQTDYFGHTRRCAYDATGQLIEQVDPLDKKVHYSYDALGRLTTRTIDGQERAIFNWDAMGNLTTFESSGVLVERCYNAANRLSTEKKGTFSLDYQYDRNGRPFQRTTSHGNCVQYSYDAMGALAAIQINDQPPVTIERNNRGQITAEHFSGSLHRSFSYDVDGLLTRQTISCNNDEIERRYSYDGAANLIAKQDSHKGDWRYSYDAMDRIIETVDPQLQTHRLAYDPCGDLVDHLPEVKESLRCAQYNNIRYHYDGAGNLVQRNDGEVEHRFEWDALNHLITICQGDELNITMVYDALGRRHEKATKGKRTFFNWEGHTLVSEQSEDGVAREYVYYPGTRSPLAVIAQDKQVYYYHNDMNSLPLELTTPNGDIVWSAAYDALGRVEQLNVDTVPQPLRLPGQYHDEEIGLCYNGRRYFEPVTCAYISQNPLGPSDGENLYAYASNVWTPVDKFGFCKALLKKTSFRKHHNDIKNACVLPVPWPAHKFRSLCFSGGISPLTIQTGSPETLMHSARLSQDEFSNSTTSAFKMI